MRGAAAYGEGAEVMGRLFVSVLEVPGDEGLQGLRCPEPACHLAEPDPVPVDVLRGHSGQEQDQDGRGRSQFVEIQHQRADGDQQAHLAAGLVVIPVERDALRKAASGLGGLQDVEHLERVVEDEALGLWTQNLDGVRFTGFSRNEGDAHVSNLDRGT